MNKARRPPPTPSPRSSSETNSTNISWNSRENSQMYFSRRGTLPSESSWSKLAPARKNATETWSTSAWGFATRTENGSTTPKRELLLWRGKWRLSFTTEKASSANWPQETSAEVSKIRWSIWLSTANPPCSNTPEKLRSRKTSAIWVWSPWLCAISPSRPRRETEWFNLTSNYIYCNGYIWVYGW